MDIGFVTLYFNETVNISSFDCTELTLSSDSNCNNSYQLTGCTIDESSARYSSEDIGTSGSGSTDYGSAAKWMTVYHYATEISLNITHEDLNQLKALRIADEVFNTYLTFTNVTIQDQSDISVMPISCSMGEIIDISDYTPDTTRPLIRSFDLSINDFSLVLSFSETIDPEMLRVSEISFQNDPNITEATQQYTLNLDPLTNTLDSPTDTLTINISPDNMNEIKKLTELAVSNLTTYLSLTERVIQDMKGSKLVPVSPITALPVRRFYPDITPPVLYNFSLDLNQGQVSLTFDETVLVGSLYFTGLTFQVAQSLSSVIGSGAEFNMSNGTNETFYDNCTILQYSLTNGNWTNLNNTPIFTFNLTSFDLNNIKRELCLATSITNTYLRFSSGTIQDMNENELVEISQEDASQAYLVIPDRTRPQLVSFELNLTSEILTLTFDETVLASSLDPTELIFQSQPVLNISYNETMEYNGTNITTYYTYDTTVTNYTLTGGTLLNSDNPILYLKLTKTDLDNVKAIIDLVSDSTNSYMSFSEMLVRDMSNNLVTEVDEYSPLLAMPFTEDSVPPTLSYFNLDLDNNTITLEFSETVNVDTLDVTGLTLISDSSPKPDQEWMLTNSSYSISPNRPLITIHLGYEDMNAIRYRERLATERNNTYILMSSSTIKDMNNNSVVPITSSSTFRVTEYIPDSTPPYLTHYHIDMDSGLMTLFFSETVNASSLELGQLLIQNSSELTDTYLSVYNSSVSLINSDVLYIKFGLDFLNHLKRTDYLTTSPNDTYLSFPDSALLDMAMNEVIAIDNSTAESVALFIYDTTDPQLIDFDLDMNEGILTLSFSETVHVSSIDVTQLQFLESGSVSSGLDASIESYTLSNGTVQMFNYHIVDIQISLYDLNEIKKLRGLATNSSNTHFSLTSEALVDMFDNNVTSISDYDPLQVQLFTNDTTQPDVVFYNLDMNTGFIYILFTETVDMETLVIRDTVIFYNSTDFIGLQYTLMDSVSNSTDGPELLITLSPNDLNRLKFIRGLADNSTNTFLFFNETIKDMVGNIITPLYNDSIETRPVRDFTPDDTNPDLISFDFDLDSGELFLTFSEVVDSIDVTSITLQDERWESNTTVWYSLTGYQSITGTSLLPNGPGHPPHVTITLTDYDLNAIKEFTSLAVSPTSTFLSATELTAMDAFGNPLNEISFNDSLPVNQWTNDTTSPVLLSFNFSADTGILELLFDETVDITSFDVTTVVFVNPNTSTQYQLQYSPPQRGATLSMDNSTLVVLKVANDDLNEIKILTDLATSFTDTYLQLEADTITDMSQNLLNTSNQPLQVHYYTADTTHPMLSSFNLNMNTGVLSLYFNESVDVATLNLTQITLQSNDTLTIDYYSLQYIDSSDGTFTNSTNGPIVHVYLGITDTNNIKRIFPLATSSYNTYISITPELISDMVGLSVVPIETDPSEEVDVYVPDTTFPIFTGFDFDLDSGIFVVTFDETVDASTFQPISNRITFQTSARSPVDSYSLLLAGVIENDDPILTYQIQDDDLHMIKKKRLLATGKESTYLNLLQRAVYDMALLPNPLQDTVLLVSNYEPDLTSPRLTNWIIDLNNSLLTLNFDEPVDQLTLIETEITFQNTPIRSSDTNEYYTLTGGYTSSSQGLQILVHITNDDLNQIKFRHNLLVSLSTSYLSFSSNLIKDMNSRKVVPHGPDNATRAYEIYQDDIRPYLLEYHLDMDGSLLHLTFLETVNASSINFTSFVLQSASDVSSEIMYYRLTDGSLVSYTDNTVISINITLTDLNAIKSQMIARSTETTWLTIDHYGLQDMNDLYIRPLLNGISAMQASQYTIDTTQPELESFTLDLNTGIITLYFSETVRASSLNATTISLQDGTYSSGSTSLYRLSDNGVVSLHDGPILILTLNEYDLNELKRQPGLSTGTDNTYISVRSSTVYDMQMNYLIPIPNGGALQANTVLRDTTEPTLLEFSYDMDSGNLTLTFNEPINTTAFISSGITLEGSGGDIVTLTGGLIIDCYSTVLTLVTDSDDLDSLKRAGGICSRNDSTCILYLSENSAIDMAGNGNNATTINSATTIITDTTVPYLVYYDLDLTAETLTLTFSEYLANPNPTKDGLRGIKIQASRYELVDIQSNRSDTVDPNDPNAYCDELRAHNLTGSNAISGPIFDPGHPPVLVINLTRADLNVIKSLTTVATSSDNTYLLISPGSASDAFGNELNGTREDSAIPVRVFNGDTISPVFENFTLDMNTGAMVLSFSESINISSLSYTGISLQGSADYRNSSLYTLTGGTTDSCNAPFITVYISKTDFDLIKKDTKVATGHFFSFISLASGTVTDMAGNPLIGVPAVQGAMASSFVSDSNPPSLFSFVMDMDDGVLLLLFNETVNSTSFQPQDLLLLPQSNATTEGLFVNNTGALLSDDNTTMRYMLSIDDLNELKRIELCTAEANGEDCYLSFPDTLVSDMNDNPVLPITTLEPFKVSNYINDQTSPHVVSFFVNMSYGEVTLRFSETVNVSTFNFSALTLHETSLEALPSHYYRLTGGERITMDNGLTVSFVFNKEDVEFLRVTDSFYDSGPTTYISAESTAILDMSGNPLEPLMFYRVTEFAPDIVRPYIIGAVLNMDQGSLQITFSETVLESSFRPNEITLLNDPFNITSSFKLSFYDPDGSDSTVISYDLIDIDVLQIKALEELATSVNSSYLNHTSNLVMDKAGNNATISEPFQVTLYIPDNTPPGMMSFDVLDLTNRYLDFTFTEPIDIDTVNPSYFTIQQHLRNIFERGTNFTLSSDSTLSYISPDTEHKQKLRIYLTADDYKSIVLDDTFGTLGGDTGNTFISVLSGGVSDFAGNPLLPISPNSGVSATTVIDDESQPNLLSFDLDIDAGLLTLTFDNVMDTSTLNPTGLTLLNSPLSPIQYRLTGGSTESSHDYVVIVNITDADLNAIKKNTSLATSHNNTYISIIPELIESYGSDPENIPDGDGQPVNAISITFAKQVISFTNDTTSPYLVSFHVDMNSGRGLLELTFDETVDAQSFLFTELVLSNQAIHNISETNGTVYYLTTGGTDVHPPTVSSTEDSTIIRITLGFDDSNNIKRLTDLFTNRSDTYISFGSQTVLDMNYNEVTDIMIEDPRQASSFIPDSNPPQLTNYTLNLDTGLLLLTFNEAIDTITFDPTGISLQSSEFEPDNRFTLTSDSYNISNDDYILVVQIGFHDLNEIKRLPFLAESQSSTYLLLTSDTIQDMNENNVQAVIVAAPRLVTQYIVDSTNPELVSFHLNMNAGTIQLNFTETVNVSTFIFTYITLHSDDNDTLRQSHTLTDAIRLTDNLYYPTIQLVLPDQYAIKLLTDLATMIDDTYIEIQYSTVRDVSSKSNPVNAVLLGPDNGTYTGDITPPLATICTVNLNLSTITITFNEPVNATSLNASAFILYSGTTDVPLRLTGGTTYSENGRQIELLILKDDLDEVKRLEDLFVSVDTSRIYFDTDAIRDMADNPILSRSASSSLLCSNLTHDTTRPYLMAFDFDANTGTLLLHFSETVNYASLNITSIALQQDFEATGLNDTVRLSGGEVRPMDSVTIEVKLNDNDRNLLKTYKIGINNYTLWLTIEDSSILDQSDEPLVGRYNNISAIPVTEYTFDVTEPTLVSFSLNLDGEYILLTFSESVDASTLDVADFTLQNSINNTLNDSFTYFTLTESSYNWNYDIKEQKIFLSKDDLNEIKRLYLLASHENNTFISIEYGGVRDVFGNLLESVNSSNATKVSTVIPDTTHPTLVSFNLNLTSETLELTFDETVNASTLDVTGFSFQSDSVYVINDTYSYTLTSSTHIEGGDPIGQDSTVIVISLSTSDLNKIKEREYLATNSNDTFLTITSYGISDMSGNSIVPIELSNAREVYDYYEDTIEPVLVDFELDMDIGLLRLTFTETVNGSSLVPTELTLLGETMDNTTSARLELTGAKNYTLDYSTVINLFILESDLNEIKRQRGLAANNMTTYISISSEAIDDMNKNNVTMISLHDPKPVKLYTPDMTSPRLIAFDFNLTSDILTLYFSETVYAASIKPVELTFINNSDAGVDQLWSLLYDGELLSNDSTVIEIRLDNNDLNEIKIREALATNGSDTYLSATSSLIVDMNNNSLILVPLNAPLSVSDFTPDHVRPDLSSFDLDMDGEGYLHLTFSESVNITSLDVTQITLASDTSNATEKYVIGSLGPGSYSNGSNGPVFSVLLHFDDINGLKMLVQLVTSNLNTYISITDSMINDMNGNPINSISLDNAKQVNIHTADTTPPTLESFSLDLNIGLLNLTFSETVFGETLNRSSITLYNNSNGTGSYYRLEESDTEYLPIHYVLPVVLSTDELNDIKQIPDLATSPIDSWLSIDYKGVEDANINPLIPIPPSESIPLNSYIQDITSPQLESFSIDLNEGTLTLEFDETVRSQSLNLSQITLQNDTALTDSHHTLTGGEWSSEDSTVIIIYFSHYDLNKIKQIRELASSNSTDNTFISFTEYMISDMNDRPVVPILSSQSREADNYTEDTTKPELLSFDFDLNSEQLTLTFTETVDTLTLMTNGITIFGITISMNETLTGGYTPSDDWYIIVIQLSIDDINDIKRNLDVAVSTSTTNIFLTETAIYDMNDNELNFTAPLEVTGYFNDTRPPILVSYDLDMDSDLLILTFNETMRVDTLNITGLTIQDSYNLSSRVNTNDTSHYALQYSTVISSDDPIVSISLHPDDINYIKTFINLASNRNNTYLSLSSYFMKDMNTNAVTSIDEMEAESVNIYTPDTTSPVLVYYTLDLTTELLYMVFNETVNITSIDATALSILYNTTIQYKLTGGLVSTTTNHTNVTLELTTFDLNEIKKNELLATSLDNTYIYYPQSFIEDMNGNPVRSISPLNPLQTQHFEPDYVNPVLRSYHLDMNQGLINLTFSETVRASTLNPSSYTLFASGDTSSNNSITNYTLLDGWTNSDNGPILTLRIPEVDLNNIKRIRDLATDINSTFLSVDSEGVYDMNNNSLVPIDPMMMYVQQAERFTPDSTRPSLISYDLDMNAGTGLLWLTFSETMLVSSLDATQITLLSSNDTESTYYTLTNDSVISEESIDDTIVSIVLSLFDSNEIKKLTDLATSNDDTHLLLTNETVVDMNNNPVHSTPFPVSVFNYTDDTTDPKLNEFIIDMNSNTLTLLFSETVNVATLNVTEILLQDETGSYPTLELSTDSYSNTSNGPIVLINISFYDINTLTSYTNLYNGRNDSYITLTDTVISDMNSNNLVPLTAHQTIQYIPDITNPKLDYFDVDLDNGTIRLVFDETVSLETIDYTKFHLYSDEYGTINITLANGSYNELYTYDVTLYMIRSDIDRTKVTEYIWTSINDTYLYIEEGAIYDWTMLNPVESTVLRATDDPIEEVSPLLLSYAVNMTSGIITLNFDEPVRPMTLVYQRFILQNTPTTNNDTIDYRLTGGFSPSPNGRMIEVHITHYDLNFIKSLTTLYTSKSTTYLTLFRGAVRDMVLNPSSEIIGKQVDIYMDDTKDPYLISYQLDMDTGIMILNFSESIDVSSVILSEFILQVDSNVSYDHPMDYHVLTNQSYVNTSDTTYNLDNKTVILTIHLNDLNEIKRKEIANSFNNTWLVINDGALFDNNKQPIIPLVNGITAKRPLIYTNDSTDPALEYFDLSMNAGTLVLSFSETVDATLLDVTQITLQNHPINATQWYTLNDSSLYERREISVERCTGVSSGSGSSLFNGSGSSILVEVGDALSDVTLTGSSVIPALSSFNHHILTVHLSHSDLNNIKALTSLASYKYNTYVSITSDTVSDMVGNQVEDIPITDSELVTKYGYDNTRPEIVSFDLDIDSSNLTITFTETINVSSLDVTQLRLQSEQDHFNQVLSSYTFTSFPPYPNTTASFSEDSPIIVVQIGHDDLNSIKNIRSLATSVSDTYLSYTSSAIRDNAGNPLVSCVSLFARPVTGFIDDKTRPQLISYDIDLDNGRLILTFSESVKVVDSLDVMQITLLTQTDETNYTLTDFSPFESSSLDSDGPVVTIRLGFTDLNEIKYLTSLATTRNTTFLSITNLTVRDLRDFPVVPISEDDPLQVRIHTPDTTRPILVNYTLDMATTTLTLVFNETVDSESLNVSHITLQHDRNSSSSYHSSPYSLTPSVNETYTSSDDDYIIVVHLGPADRNELKRRQNLAVSLDTTWLVATGDSILDMNGNKLVDIVDGDAQQAVTFINDSVPPVLVEFSIDMDAGVFVLTFDETISAETLIVTELTFQDNETLLTTNYTLTNGSTSSQSDNTTITVTLSIDDLNELKKLTLCREVATCYIRHEFSTVLDMNDNSIEAREDGDALQVSQLMEDITRPVLLSYNTNLTREVIVMTFTETINATSINFTAFTLQDFFERTYSYQLTDGRVHEEDSTIITFNFSWFDLNEIKRNTDIYTDRTNAWLTITEYAIHDMALIPNYVIPIPDTTILAKGIVTKDFYPDLTRPELWDFDLNLTSHLLTLYFSETMLARSLDINQIVIQNERNSSTESVQLTMGELPWYSQSFSEDYNIIVIELGQIDTDRIKAFTRLATDDTNTFISITSSLIRDMNDNPVVPIYTDFAQEVEIFYPDLIRPHLLSYWLDLNSSQLTLTFSEAINASSLLVDQVVLHSESNGLTINHTLTNITEAHAIIGLMSDDDYINTTSGSGSDNTWMYSGSGSGNDSDVVMKRVYYHGNCTEDKSVFLPYHSFTLSKDVRIIVIQIGFIDINRINMLTDLATNTNNTFLSLSSTSFHDMNRNELIPVSTDMNISQATRVQQDTTPPQIVFFNLNMTSEILSLTFNEVVRGDTFNVESITIQQLSYTPLVSILDWYTLTGEYGDHNDDYIVNVQLTITDLNAIKYLTQIATTLNNTHLSFAESLVRDMHDNPVVPLPNGKAIRVGCFTEDIISPELTYFHLDMDKGLLHLTFSETVNIDSFDVTQIRLQDSNTNRMNRIRTLTPVSTHSPDPTDTTVVIVSLGPSDINRIKSIEMFALSTVDTWITITEDLLVDMNNNSVVPIPDGNAMRAANFTADTTHPYLIEYHIDFINEEITLHFNEPINDTTIRYDQIEFQDNFISNDTYSLTGGEATVYNDALIIVITLNSWDAAQLKMHPSLLTSVEDSYITYTSEAFTDTATIPNPVLPLIDSVNATRAKTFLHYPPPVFVSLRPRAARASGGTVLTIVGNNFGPVEGEKGSRQVDVLINFKLSPNTTVIVSNTTLEAITPPADISIIGVPVTLTITVDNSSLMINITKEFTYLAPPVIRRLYPIVGTIYGDTLLTVYGENFGHSTASGEGPVVSVTVGNETCSNVTVISNYTLTCLSPSLEPDTYDIAVTVDEVTTVYEEAFTSLVPPTVTGVSPPSTYKTTPITITIYGTQFGPTTASNDSLPVIVYLTSQFEESNCTNVTIIEEDNALTCIVQPNLGPSNITVIVDDVESMESNITFFHYDNPGNFSFRLKEFFISETELYGNVTIVRHDYPPFASPANITVQAYNGTALSPYQFIAANITRWIPYSQNSINFPIRVTARSYEPMRIRKGADDDAFINVRIVLIEPLHGRAQVKESETILTIKAICEAVTHLCIADWDVNANDIVYYRLDELP